MIAIVNVSAKLKPKGKQTYSLRINNKEICRFIHNREDDLATCLELAANAYRLKNVSSMIEFTKFCA